MGIFDLFSSGSSSKMSRKGFGKRLSGLSPSKKAYVRKAFNKDLGDGLSKFEIERKCRELKHKTGDPLQSHEIDRIKKNLLKDNSK